MTHYEVLQVAPTAPPEIIKVAYRTLALKYHPDTYPGSPWYAEQKMKELNEAYRVLSSPLLRQEYDRLLQCSQIPPKMNYQQKQPTSPPPEPAKKTKSKSSESGSGGILGAIGLQLLIRIGAWILIIAVICLVGFVIDGIDKFKSASTTSSNVSTTIKQEPTSVPEPQSGAILSGAEDFNGSEITIKASTVNSCVVKLKTTSGIDRLSFYVRAGDTVTVGVPAECLYVYFASGDTWYGKNLLFGEDTYYSMDDELADFTQYTWEYTLTPITNGNFSETPIDASEF